MLAQALNEHEIFSERTVQGLCLSAGRSLSSVTFSDQILSIRPLIGSSSEMYTLKCIRTGTLGLCNLQDQEGSIGSKQRGFSLELSSPLPNGTMAQPGSGEGCACSPAQTPLRWLQSALRLLEVGSSSDLTGLSTLRRDLGHRRKSICNLEFCMQFQWPEADGHSNSL